MDGVWYRTEQILTFSGFVTISFLFQHGLSFFGGIDNDDDEYDEDHDRAATQPHLHLHIPGEKGGQCHSGGGHGDGRDGHVMVVVVKLWCDEHDRNLDCGDEEENVDDDPDDDNEDDNDAQEDDEEKVDQDLDDDEEDDDDEDTVTYCHQYFFLNLLEDCWNIELLASKVDALHGHRHHDHHDHDNDHDDYVNHVQRSPVVQIT